MKSVGVLLTVIYGALLVFVHGHSDPVPPSSKLIIVPPERLALAYSRSELLAYQYHNKLWNPLRLFVVIWWTLPSLRDLNTRHTEDVGPVNINKGPSQCW